MCAIFGVNTIYVYAESAKNNSGKGGKKNKDNSGKKGASATATGGGHSDSDLLVLSLRYVETPQFLRRQLFPRMNDLKFAGMMLPLRIPSHTTTDSDLKNGQVREGMVVVARGGRFVDIGIKRLLRYGGRARPGTRITIKIRDVADDAISYTEINKEDAGKYWGYDVKRRASLRSLLAEWRISKGQTIITSKKGRPVTSHKKAEGNSDSSVDHAKYNSTHNAKDTATIHPDKSAASRGYSILRDCTSDLLVVFGSPERGVHEILGGGRINAISDARILDFFPGQHTATVRLEEAMMGVLAMINAEVHTGRK